MKKVLFIDTTSNKEVKIGLRIDGKEFILAQKVDKRRAQATLPLIDKILKDNKLLPEELTQVEVNVKLGSFTGVRVGTSIANALGFTLKIPIKKVLY